MNYIQGFIEKLAYTAMDKFQGIWRANGGFAKQIAPYLKAATPGLTPKIEQSVFQRVGSNPSLTQKYKQLLESRMATKPKLKDMFPGKNLADGGEKFKRTSNGDFPSDTRYVLDYKNKGKVVTDLDPEEKLQGILSNVGRKVNPALNSGELRIDYDANKVGAGVSAKFNSNTGESLNNNTDNPVVMHLYGNAEDAIKGTKVLPEDGKYLRGIITNHESNEFVSQKTHRPIKVKKYNNGNVEDIYTPPGIGTHRSYSVLGHEQVDLRHVPDSVYNNYISKRVIGDTPYAVDSEKLDMLKQHGANFKTYGTDLRYRSKEVKSVDKASVIGMKKTHEEITNNARLLDKKLKWKIGDRQEFIDEYDFQHEKSLKNNYPRHGNIPDYTKGEL